MNDAAPPLQFVSSTSGARLAVRERAGAQPTLLFLPGYASDMAGAKALAIDRFAAERGLALLRFDYSGTGESDGRFVDGTLDRWLAEALLIADTLTAGPLVVIGSSMGGWLALHLALLRPDRVRALVGIAAAPDFTDWGFGADEVAELERSGRLERKGQATTAAFWRSGQTLRLLGAPIAIDCPVRLVHGELDRDVPVDVAMRLVERLRSADVQLNIIKGGGHRLSEPREIAAILRAVAELVELS
ncbi:alpha/beta hydrolase [Sphingomonas sp.]|uniref:alpha/beta fold hydrolase n=1 Tax=Sphingomonas sp. TaxID=28214 RepID=UPI00286E2D91|nr:alpha/beta hydrolase [Sphingomonas sp.]